MKGKKKCCHPELVEGRERDYSKNYKDLKLTVPGRNVYPEGWNMIAEFNVTGIRNAANSANNKFTGLSPKTYYLELTNAAYHYITHSSNNYYVTANPGGTYVSNFTDRKAFTSFTGQGQYPRINEVIPVSGYKFWYAATDLY